MTVTGGGWTTAAAVKVAVRKKWDSGALLRDLNASEAEWVTFPLRLRLPGPSRDQLGTQFAAAAAWARELAAAAAREGWTLQMKPMQAPGLGAQQLPVAALVPTPADGLRLLGHEAAAAAARFTAALSAADKLGPEARKLALARPHDVLAAGDDWRSLLALAAWIRDHPRPGIYVRQIPVAGVHTKVLERNAPLLARLLETLLPADAVDPAGRSFASRFGFGTESRRVRIRGATSVLGVPGAGVTDVEWEIAALAALDPHAHAIRELLVLENKTSFLAVPVADGRLVVWGAGYGVDELLATLPWRREVAVRYWSDIDTHGFVMLARVRAVAPQTVSVLMDSATLLQHRPYWSEETAPRIEPLLTLNDAEQALYAALCRDEFGHAVRLEQEFIGFDRVAGAL